MKLLKNNVCGYTYKHTTGYMLLSPFTAVVDHVQ